MATKLDPASKIKQLADDFVSFVVNGGAGSGKTHTLMDVMDYVCQKNPEAKVACITYTNVAVDEVIKRMPFENVEVSTIHDFVWSFVSRYQHDVKIAFTELLESGDIRYSGDKTMDMDYLRDKHIEYREWESFEKGVVSHNQVLLIAQRMFEKSELLSRILEDRYKYIFVDEYQDAPNAALDILINHINRPGIRNAVGLFGDRMQAIYKQDMSKIEEIHGNDSIVKVLLEGNRRNPKSVIGLINKLRTDELVQQPAEDPNSPNFQKSGSIKFVYPKDESYSIDNLRASRFLEGWNFDDPSQYKELYLVKKLIAGKAGFPLLMDIYANDQIIKYKNMVAKEVKDRGLAVETDDTFAQVIEKVHAKPSSGKMQIFIRDYPELFEYAKSLPYEKLSGVHLDTDQLIGNKKKLQEESALTGKKRDPLINHLLDIQECIRLYDDGLYSKFIRKTTFAIDSVESKRRLRQAMDDLISMQESTLMDVINYAHESGVLEKPPNLEEFIKLNGYVLKRIESVRFSEIAALHRYIEDQTPFSTQHGTKGAEYDNVLMVLDNGGWNKYNFKELFENTGNHDVRQRTSRLFYVCCSRAKNNLVVYYHNPGENTLSQAREWFGESNVVCINK